MLDINILDGGMLYELNKKDKDVGDNAILNNPNLVKSIHQQYIDIGCQYITTANYGFKPRRQDNWDVLTERACNILYSLKKQNNFNMMASIPPYYESYQDGSVNKQFCDYYITLVDIFEPYADYYLLETCVSINHIMMIIEIIQMKSKKPIIVAIYPNSKIKLSDLTLITNISGLMVNCCDYQKMMNFFKIVPEVFFSPEYFIGFYCNKINETAYKDSCTNNTRPSELEKYKNDNEITEQEIIIFMEKYGKNAKILIGGCCGYGVEEMKELITLLV